MTAALVVTADVADRVAAVAFLAPWILLGIGALFLKDDRDDLCHRCGKRPVRAGWRCAPCREDELYEDMARIARKNDR